MPVTAPRLLSTMLFAQSLITASLWAVDPVFSEGTVSTVGETWTERTIGDNRIVAAVAVSSNGVRMMAAEKTGSIWVSKNAGRSWTIRGSSQTWRGIAISDDGLRAAAVTESGPIYTTADGGTTWVERASSRAWRGIATSSDGSHLVAVVYDGFVYTSTDYGVTWVEVGPRSLQSGLDNHVVITQKYFFSVVPNDVIAHEITTHVLTLFRKRDDQT